MPEEEKLIQEQLNKLPLEVRKAINDVPWKEIVEGISVAINLSQEQSENLIRETIFIIYGFENPAEYINKLVQEVPLDEETAVIVAEMVNERILKPVSEKINAPKDSSHPMSTIREIHPMVEEGEVAHNVPHSETPVVTPIITPQTITPQPPPTSTAAPTQTQQQIKPEEKPKLNHKSHYAPGQDPYREPIE